MNSTYPKIMLYMPLNSYGSQAANHNQDTCHLMANCSKAMRKGPEFYMTNCCRAVYVGNIAKLLLKNLNLTENTLSGAWFCELLYDWSKSFLGLRIL